MGAVYYDDGGTGPVEETAVGDDIDVEAWLDRAQAAHADHATAELAAIDDQLAAREAIHQEIVDDLAWELARYTEKLRTLYQRGTGRDGRRTQLKDRIVEFETALREEYIAVWRDRQELAADRRAIERELTELDTPAWSDLL